MAIKLQRIEKCIQEIQQFVNDNIEQDQIFGAVSQALVSITNTLKEGKLTVQIVSYNQALGQKLQSYFHKYATLGESYRFPSILQICSLNSPTDTYIDGQPLQKYRALHSGDRITLGYEKQTEESTKLLLESDNEFSRQLAGCNILCLVIAPNQMHRIDQAQLVQQISKTQISTIVVVVEIPEFAGNSALQANTIKDEVWAWLQSDSYNAQTIEVCSTCQSDLEIFCYSLETLAKRRTEDILIKQITTQMLTQLTLIENFLIKQMRELEIEHQQDKASLAIVGGDRFRRQFDETMKLVNYDKASTIREIKSSVNQSVTDLLDKFFRDSIICQIRSYVYALEAEIVKQQEGKVYIRIVKKIKKLNKYSVQKQDQIYSNYNEASLRAFSQKNKRQLKLTTKSLLSSYFWQSLLSKVFEFQFKYKIELLKEDSIDANTVLTEYYRHTLSKWATKEWQNICNIYAKGGLRRFFQTTYERFKLIPSLNIESSFWEPSQYIDITHNFAKTIEKPDCETSYRKISLLSFIFGRIRNNLMPFLTISFVLSILGIATRRQIARWFFQPVLSAFEYAYIPTFFMLVFVIYFLVKALFQTYYKHSLGEMKKAEVKLKDELFQFYSGLIQHLIDKIRQEILSTIEIKEQWLDENVQAYRQLLDQTNGAAESNQPLIRKRIEEQKEQLKNLNHELGNLQKLKKRI